MINPPLVLSRRVAAASQLLQVSSQASSLVLAASDGLLLSLSALSVAALSAAPLLTDTKSAAICALRLLAPDTIIVADSEGAISFFARNRTVFRRFSGSPIVCLDVVTDGAGGEIEVLAGDIDGRVIAFSLLEEKWCLKVGGLDHHNLKIRPARTLGPGVSVLSRPPEQLLSQTAPLAAILAVKLIDRNGVTVDYVLACDGSPKINFLKNRELAFWMPVPCVINTMCWGYFWIPPDGESRTRPQTRQVLFAGEDGNIYVFDSFCIHLYAVVDYPITSLVTITAQSQSELDSVACIGYFAGFRIYRDAKLLSDVELPDFPHSMSFNETAGLIALILPPNVLHVYCIQPYSPLLQQASQSTAPPPSKEDMRKKLVLDIILAAAEARPYDPTVFLGLEDAEIDDGTTTEDGEVRDDKMILG